MCFLSIMFQDMISYALWRLGVNVSPENHFATDQEVEVKVQRRCCDKQRHQSFFFFAWCFFDLLVLTDFSNSWQNSSKNDSNINRLFSFDTANWDLSGLSRLRLRLSRRHSQGSFSPVAPEPSVKASSNEISQTERWKVRVEHDFKFGPKEFGRLPLWAHFMPAAAAQFLTILSLIVVSGGVAFFLGMCDGRTGQTGILWWNDELCH